MANVRTFSDLPLGAIVTSKQGTKYVLLRDDNHQNFLINDKANYIRCDENGLTFGKNHMTIQRADAFTTLPPADAVSESLKVLFRPDRPACADLKTVYTAEPAEVTAARKALADAQAAADRARAVMAAYGF